MMAKDAAGLLFTCLIEKGEDVKRTQPPSGLAGATIKLAETGPIRTRANVA
jgi:hypothetical protein